MRLPVTNWLRRSKRKPLAIYANYSLHYVGGMPKGMVSADYYGEFARLILADR